MAFGKPNVIKKRVMAVIESRIQEAETQYEQGCEKFDNEAAVEVAKVYEARDNAKLMLSDQLVHGIIGKVL